MMGCARYKELFGLNVAVVGASEDKDKFSNKAVRALHGCGYKVYPINPKEGVIEGINIHKRIEDIEENIDFASVYLSADKVLDGGIIEKLKERNVKGVILNPGTQDKILIEKLRKNGFKVLLECTIRSLGKDPDLL